MIMLLAIRGRLRTRMWLYTKGICPEKECPLCGCQDEVLDHVFMNCAYSGAVLKPILSFVKFHCKDNGWD